jgi:hypothetical protein
LETLIEFHPAAKLSTNNPVALLSQLRINLGHHCVELSVRQIKTVAHVHSTIFSLRCAFSAS